MARLGGEQQEAGRRQQHEGRDRDAARAHDEAHRRGRRKPAQQADVHDRDRAREHREREDMTDIRHRKQPHRLPDGGAETRLFERDEDRRRLTGHQRSS